MINKIKKYLIELLLKSPRAFDSYRKLSDKFKSKSEEKKFLRKAADNLNKPLKIIQIGSNDGLRGDPVRELIIDFNCTALLVEADPICFTALKKNYSYLRKMSLSFEHAAIVPFEDENLTFYSLSNEMRSSLPRDKQVILARKASTDKTLFIEYLEKIGIEKPEAAVVEQKVKTKTLDDLFKLYFTPNILVIDTEGLDWSLMQSLDFSQYLPEVIYFESKYTPNSNIRQSVLEKLENAGYKIYDFENNIGCLHKGRFDS
jgi:FkbM family methyltransferase